MCRLHRLCPKSIPLQTCPRWNRLLSWPRMESMVVSSTLLLNTENCTLTCSISGVSLNIRVLAVLTGTMVMKG